MLEIPCSAKVVLRACPADGGKLTISIQIKFDFSLTPPPIAIYLPGQICAYIVSAAFYPIQYRMDLLVREGGFVVGACLKSEK